MIATQYPLDVVAHTNAECISTPKNVKVIPFVERHKLKWEPINVNVQWNESKQKYDKHLQKGYEYDFKPSSKDFVNLDDATLRSRQSFLEWYEHIAIHTGDVCHIDVDNLNMTPALHSQVEEWKTRWPYYLSASKKLPHFFVKFDEPFKNDRLGKTKYEGIEILSGQWGWCPKTADIINADKEIPVLRKSDFIDVPYHRPKPIEDANKEINKKPLSHSAVKIKDILGKINIQYCDQYESWFRIGCALFNSGCSQDVFDEFSKRSSKYSADAVLKLWNGLHAKPYEEIQFGTIMHYLQQSDEFYARACAAKLKTPRQLDELKSFYRTSDMTHHKAAAIFHEAFKDKFSYSHGEWYMLTEGGIYEQLEHDTEPMLAGHLKSCLQKFLQDVIDCTTDDDKRKKLFRAQAKAEDYTFKQKCIAESKEVFLDRNLYKELNSNLNLVGFTNGVYDLDQMAFRKATIEDKISFTTGYAYSENIDQENLSFIDKLIDDYFETKEGAEWFKKHLGSFLQGGNKEEKAYFWTGRGRNGKGSIDSLTMNALGDYYATINKDFYTVTQKNAEAPAPEVIGLKHKRVGMSRELEENVPILEGAFKDKTGNDPLKARNLHEKKHETFMPSHKTIFQANDLPFFTNVTIALCSRIIVICFPFMYKDPTEFDDKNSYHRPVDPELKTKLKSCRLEFMHLLLRWFKRYKEEGLMDDFPDEFKRATDKYKTDVDSVKSFMDDVLLKGDTDDYISTAEMLALHNVYTSKMLTPQKFAQRLRNLGHDIKRKNIKSGKANCIFGFKLNDAAVDELQGV